MPDQGSPELVEGSGMTGERFSPDAQPRYGWNGYGYGYDRGWRGSRRWRNDRHGYGSRLQLGHYWPVEVCRRVRRR